MENLDVLNKDGEYTGLVVPRSECHKKGLYHKAVVLFIINSKDDILLQQRSKSKKMWPNKWDITAGGHVESLEFGYEAVIREVKEELSINIRERDLIFIGCTLSCVEQDGLIDNHFNEFYIVKRDLNIEDLNLQLEEVQALKWVKKKDLLKMIEERSTELTGKWNCWDYLKRYLEIKMGGKYGKEND